MVVDYSEEVKQAMRLHYRQLREKDRRRYAAVEALKLGYGALVTSAGCCVLTARLFWKAKKNCNS